MTPQSIKNSRVVFTVLNWGIGHASRSVPLIAQLLNQGNALIIMSDGEAFNFLKRYFPEIPFYTLPSYNVTYSQSGFGWRQIIKVLLPIFKAIRREKKAIENYLLTHPADFIISDNRYGTYSDSCVNILITHQLQLVCPNLWIQLLSRKITKRFVEKFQAIWIPDSEECRLSGKMTEPKLSIPKIFIGLKSHINFEPSSTQNAPYNLVLLSGPMPSRAYLEEEMKKRIYEDSSMQYILVAGDFSKPYYSFQKANLTYHSQLTQEKLTPIILGANCIYCRSGYSTLVDLFRMGKSNIVCIPTPKQLEQEYLADYFLEKGYIKKVLRLGV